MSNNIQFLIIADKFYKALPTRSNKTKNS